MKTAALLALPLAFLLVALVWPLGHFLAQGLGSGLAVLAEPWALGRLGWTFGQAAFSVLLASLVAVPLAWMLSQHELPLGRALLRFSLLPFVTPVVVVAIGLNALWGPRGLDMLPSQGWQMLVLGNIFYNLPVILRLSTAAFERVPPRHSEAARSLGATPPQAFVKVVLPQAAPGVVSGMLLAFLYASLAFGVPLMLGGGKAATLEVEIYTLAMLALRLPEAAALALLGMLLAGGSVALQVHLSSFSGGTRRPKPKATGATLWLGTLLIGLVFALCFLPIAAVLRRSLLVNGAIGLDHWAHVIADPKSKLQLLNTLRFAAVGGALAALLGVLHALGAWRSRSKFMAGLTLLPLLASPVSLSVGYIFSYPQALSSLGLLMSAFTLGAYPLLTRSLLPALQSISPRTLEAAATLGASSGARLRRVVWPLSKSALLGGFALALAALLGEFGATLVLARPEWQTLSGGLYERLGRPGERNFGEAAALASMLLILAGGVFWALDGGEGEV